MAYLPVEAVSSYGLIQIGEESLLFDSKKGTIFEQEKIIRTLAKSLASQVIIFFLNQCLDTVSSFACNILA